MKNSLLYKLSLLLLLSFIGLSYGAQAQTISKPGMMTFYHHNPSTGTWIHDCNVYYTYNAAGQLTEKILTLAANNQNYEKENFTYNSLGDETSFTRYEWQNNKWVSAFAYRKLLTYTPNNQLSESIYQEFDSTGAAISVNNTIYSYNNGLLTETLFQLFDSMGTAINISKTIYSYNNGILTEKLVQNVDIVTNSWKDNFRQTNLTWNKPDELTFYFQQNKINNTWMNAARYTAVYDSLGGYVGTTETWKNNTWVNNNRKTISKDARNNVTNELVEQWQTNNTWARLYYETSQFTYSTAGDLVEKTHGFYSQASYSYNESKEVYSNFQHFSLTGLKKEIPQEISANVYPNPAQNLITIEIPENVKFTTVQLSDLTGKVILTQTFRAEETKQLNIEKLAAGIYLLHLETEKGKTVQKIIKR
jgi:hypothetical protein